MRRGVELQRACVLGDFFIVPQYRTLGPAVQLQRACLASVANRCFDFCYDFPAAAMLPVYRRLFIEPTDTHVRLVKPLRADRKIHRWVETPWLANKLAHLVNFGLGVRDFLAPGGSGYEVSLHSGACAEEFTELAISAAPQYGLCTDRSARYLNWRYKNHYSVGYEFLTARGKDGKLLAYVVYTHHVDDPEIVDLFGRNETAVLSALVSSAVNRLRSYGATTVAAPILSSDLRVSLFEKLGFYRREGCPVITHPIVQSNEQGEIPRKLFLMQGDRES
jgi:hypothetical protein